VSFLNPKQAAVESGFHWYAVYTHSRKESFVASQLEGRGLECFLPTYKSVRQWSDRVKELHQPLFPGYLFCRFDYQDRRPVVMTPGVLQVVGNGKSAIPVADEEIVAIQAAVSSGLAHQPWPHIAIGERVRVVHGTLAGIEGILIKFKGSHRVVLSVSLLQRSVAFEAELSWLAPIQEHRQVTSGVGLLNTSPASGLVR